ncbi:E3 ubiquitin-protein ligase MARCHF3-like [Branchiostoma floridae x Branchiostoma belcheri]|nr:E3 ubiquitin-protein ligase march2 [Branchiostoma belcheri]KAI8481888.1 E3 ubiquitin-protein ligase march2 [Branchiostoma belcheri]
MSAAQFSMPPMHEHSIYHGRVYETAVPASTPAEHEYSTASDNKYMDAVPVIEMPYDDHMVVPFKFKDTTQHTENSTDPSPREGICKICHEGETAGQLISPCQCTGSLGLVHRSCIELWMSSSGSTTCEICNQQFPITTKSRSFLKWLKNKDNAMEKRTFMGDMVCFLFITPLASVSGWLCLQGAINNINHNSPTEAGGLIALMVALFIIYFFWSIVSIRYHVTMWLKWRKKSPEIQLIDLAVRCTKTPTHSPAQVHVNKKNPETGF